MSITPPTVSVIIPVYQDQKGIDRCIDALTSQTYPRGLIDIIVIDNGSSPPIKLDGRHHGLARLISCDKPGAYAARNAGVGISKATYLAFTDADCVPEQDWVSSGVNALLAAEVPTIVGGHVYLVCADHPSAVERYQQIVGFMQKENIETRGFSATANLFIRHQDFYQIGLFNEELRSAGDREWCWRAQGKGYKLIYEPKAIVSTQGRTTLRAAIRQARRVAGGRLTLKNRKEDHISTSGLSRHRTIWSGFKWIIQRADLDLLQKMKIVGIAGILRAITALETLRLRLGGDPERR
jgi:glycosyltransferase involved in cell wall biosynthesis